MDLVIALAAMAGLATAVAGLWFALRALVRAGHRPAPPPARSGVATTQLRLRLQELASQGFYVEDDASDRLVLRLPLAAVASAAGTASEEYRIVVKLAAASATARLSERRVSKEAGFGGAGLLRWSAWTAPTAGARDLHETAGASGPGEGGTSYRLDAAGARALVEQTITAAGWRVG